MLFTALARPFVHHHVATISSILFRWNDTVDFRLLANEIDQSTHVIQNSRDFVHCVIVKKSREFGSCVWIDLFHSQVDCNCITINRVCVCVHMRVWGKWSGYRPANQKVAGLIPAQGTLILLFAWARNFIHIAPVYPAVKRGPGVNWGNSPPSCNISGYLGKQMLNCPCLI